MYQAMFNHLLLKEGNANLLRITIRIHFKTHHRTTKNITKIYTHTIQELAPGSEDSFIFYTLDENIPLVITLTIAYHAAQVYDLKLRRCVYAISNQFFEVQENIEALPND